MINFKKLKQELKNKERTIDDLIRFIKTRNDENPNYSLLLGAGCSITSGIDSASKLIEEWKYEIFKQENSSTEIESIKDSDLEDYFLKQMWYDSRNAYSSLFERKYDLPRQRRMFIEKEVGEKFPSIGYAYLIKLVENNYFKTLFTTNFDDLLNEAFYQYSNRRPLICAHDSSINSITITSKRPKIIKLHGDYLFDDIKSTLRETESLEENIKNKFIEFSKDYGLIVIGYGGNDRSIIDVLTYLLKNEDYFKNGIYWCLRSDTLINEDLRKLLWKDRVYYVEIDGFDELMAEINSKLNNGELPVDNSYLDKKKNDIINNLIENKYLKDTTCNYIKSDFSKLNETKNFDVINNFFEYLEQRDEVKISNGTSKTKSNEKERLSVDEKQFVIKQNEEIYSKNYSFALQNIESKLLTIDKERGLYEILLGMKAKCYQQLNKKEEAVSVFKDLIESKPKNLKNYIKISQLFDKTKDKIFYLDEGIKIDSYYSPFYYEKAKILFNTYISACHKDSLTYNLSEIEKVIEKCIEVSPIVSNPIWNIKYELLKDKITNPDDLKNEVSCIIETLEKQDKYYPAVIDMKINLLKLEKENEKEIFEYLDECIKKSVSNNYLEKIEIIYLESLAHFNRKKELKERFDLIESKYELDEHYLITKSEILMKNFGEVENSIKTLNSIQKKDSEVYNLLLDYYLILGEPKMAEKINNEHLFGDLYNRISIEEAKRCFENALKLTDEYLKLNENNHEALLRKSYILLHCGEHKESYNLSNQCLKASNFTDPYFLVNYYLAQQKLGKSIKTEKVKDKLIDKGHNDLVEAAAYALISQEKQVYNLLNKIYNENHQSKHKTKDWVVFEEVFKKDKFKKLIA